MAPRKEAKVGDPCCRCRVAPAAPPPRPAVLVSRDEPFCAPCFRRFLSTKVRKQTEAYKVAYTRDKRLVPSREHVLVPVFYLPEQSGAAGGDSDEAVVRDAWCWQNAREMAAAAVLVDLVAEIVREQRAKHRGAQGLYLHIVEVSVGPPIDSSPVRQLFHDRYAHSEIASFRAVHLARDTRAAAVLRQLPTRAARADALGLAARHLVAQTAREIQLSRPRADDDDDENSEWNMSEFVPEAVEAVAQRILANVAKGRMNLVYRDLLPATHAATHASPLLRQIWPLKDIRGAEVDQYLSTAWPSFAAAFPPDVETATASATPAVARKNMSIDALIRAYFADIDRAFPSVATTVVRTVEKLADPSTLAPPLAHMYHNRAADAEDTTTYGECALCGCARDGRTLDWIAKITVNEPAPAEDAAAASAPAPAETPAATPAVLESLCYGCIVMLKDSPIVADGELLPQWSVDTAATDSSTPPHALPPRTTLSGVLAAYEL